MSRHRDDEPRDDEPHDDEPRDDENRDERRRAPLSDHSVGELLRSTLHERAGQAPWGDDLAERIIASLGGDAAGDGPGHVPDDGDSVEELAPVVPLAGARTRARTERRRPAATWLAAAAVVAALVGVVLAVTQFRSDPKPQTGNSHEAIQTPISSSLAPSTSAPMSADTARPESTASQPVSASDLTNVKVYDATFTGSNSGWALGTADCVNGSGTCSALFNTSDGKTWKSHPHTPFHVPGVGDCTVAGTSPNCVTNIRFANSQVGYAFGPNVLYMTTNGATGATSAEAWHQLKGGADALEILDGNVIKVSDAGGCPPGCTYTVQTTSIGSTSWTTVPLPGPTAGGDGVVLSRTGKHAYLLEKSNPAGGAQSATSVLWSSSDDGASWTNRGEPCSQQGGERDGSALSTALDGSVAVLCTARTGGTRSVTVSTDDGKSFHAGTGTVPGAADTLALASGKVVLASGGSDTVRSSDAGNSFSTVRVSGLGGARMLGFADADLGHAISADGTTLWTTYDAGRTWTGVGFR